MLIRQFLLVSLLCLPVWSAVYAARPPLARPRPAPGLKSRGAAGAAAKLAEAGNYKEAYDKAGDLVLSGKGRGRELAEQFDLALSCLVKLNRTGEIDAFRDAAVKANLSNWWLLSAAAKSLVDGRHYGYIVAGEFTRGERRGGQGEYVGSLERDRVMALRLYHKALPLVTAQSGETEKTAFLDDFAAAVLLGRESGECWRLQYLTDLKELPDYDPGAAPWMWWRGGGGSPRGAPVDADGEPVFYHIPDSWSGSVNDGERWRWLLTEKAKGGRAEAAAVELIFADFLRGQFGVQTMANGGFRPVKNDDDEFSGRDDGPFSVSSLSDDETIARLATGVKRFDLPEEFNYIRIYRNLAASGKADGERALNALADIYRNRRQYPEAAAVLRENIKIFGPGYKNSKRKALDEIIGNWGKFEALRPFAAGAPARIEFRYRNGKKLRLAARRVKIEKLLRDIKTYLKSDPDKLDYREVNPRNIGWRLVEERQDEYLGAEVAAWSVDLNPLPKHFDRLTTVETPLKEAGAYLLTGRLEDGNTSQIIVWLADMAIVRKPMDDANMYLVADAADGTPVVEAELDVFGYRRERVDKKGGRPKQTIKCRDFSVKTAENGLAIFDAEQMGRRYSWLLTARRPDGSGLAYMGFDGVWYNHNRGGSQSYDQKKAYAITDRPVYRPGQKVEFKFWVRRAKYGVEDNPGEYANRAYSVIVKGPRGDDVCERVLTSDDFGGVAGEYELPADAALGDYRLSIKNISGGISFRVEEYKKPEYEVLIEAPEKPVKLGDTIEAVVKAKYYFGAPVTNAKVKYKVQRYRQDDAWYPPAPWDWLYGGGYWWFCSDYEWFPGWRRWGWPAPRPFWISRSSQPPELVAENEVEIGDDGKVVVRIDTAYAEEVFGDSDHRYEITAEVTDMSRRTIVGKGSVIAARQPFRVVVWQDTGFVRVGETVSARFAARSADGKPVAAKGMAKLFAIGYDDDGVPEEREVQSWPVATDESGRGKVEITAAEPGQYRLACELSAAAATVDGGSVFTVYGPSPGVPGDFRYNDLELSADKMEYAPGERAKIVINTARADSTVLLFVRPEGNVYPRPEIIRIDGKTAFYEIEIGKGDMPNIFVEALCVAAGRVHTAVRQLAVPPEKKMLEVAVEPSAGKYKPGEKATVELRVSDFFGEPVAGDVVVTIYDKSVEYISGGSNVPDILDFFWKWRRRHSPAGSSTLERVFGNLTAPGGLSWRPLGVFGDLVKPESEQAFGGMGGGMKRMRKSKGGERVMLGCEPPMPCAAPMADGIDAGASNAAGTAPEVQVRSNFADTAFWAANLVCDSDGETEIELDMPENLTAWKIRVWSLASGVKVGQGEAEVITSKDFLLRSQSPRFLVETDESTLSAIVHNYTDSAKSAEVSLELGGGDLTAVSAETRLVSIEPGGEVRVDWLVKATREGEAVVTMKAVADDGDSDAMRTTMPVLVHGMDKMVPFSGVIRPDAETAEFAFDVPAERRPETTVLEARYSPTLAGAMIDALPYLIDYPYGCTEQTLNRFLPAVITRSVLTDMGIDLAAIAKRRTNLNAQETGDDRERMKQWKRYDCPPVFDEEKLDEIVADGIKRLGFMQGSDGGWGWFSGWGERSFPHTTATVVHGLQTAAACGVAVPSEMLEKGLDWLAAYQKRQSRELKNAATKTKPYKTSADNLDALVYGVLVDSGRESRETRGFLYRDRNNLSVYAKALFGLALHKVGAVDERDMIVRNISQFLVTDSENQTAHLNLGGGSWWCWYGDEIEAQAAYLKLLAAVDPKSGTAPMLVKYLLNNRKHATYWRSTRDTAMCVEAFADYLKASGESNPDMTVDLSLDGKLLKSVKIDASNLFSFDNKLVVDGDALTPGEHRLEIRRRGSGPVYCNAYLSYFSLEEFISKAGLEIKVDRRLYKLEEVDKSVKVAGSRGQALDQKVEKYKRVPLAQDAELESGDLVEVELIIDSKNDYEYLIFEDYKAAGFETCEVRSGYNGNNLGAYVEYRDDRVCFFTRSLSRGRHSVSYRLRAEIPGKYSALPAKGYAMYAPELKGNSDEFKVGVEDAR